MKLKIRLRNNKIITGALMSIALVNSGCNDFLNQVLLSCRVRIM